MAVDERREREMQDARWRVTHPYEAELGLTVKDDDWRALQRELAVE